MLCSPEFPWLEREQKFLDLTGRGKSKDIAHRSIIQVFRASSRIGCRDVSRCASIGAASRGHGLWAKFLARSPLCMIIQIGYTGHILSTDSHSAPNIPTERSRLVTRRAEHKQGSRVLVRRLQEYRKNSNKRSLC